MSSRPDVLSRAAGMRKHEGEWKEAYDLYRHLGRVREVEEVLTRQLSTRASSPPGMRVSSLRWILGARVSTLRIRL